MRKILLVLFLFSIGFSTTTYAETGKNMNWCNTDGKTRSPLYLANVNGKVIVWDGKIIEKANGKPLIF